MGARPPIKTAREGGLKDLAELHPEEYEELVAKRLADAGWTLTTETVTRLRRQTS